MQKQVKKSKGRSVRRSARAAGPHGSGSPRRPGTGGGAGAAAPQPPRGRRRPSAAAAPRPGRIALPFETRRRGDSGDWIYRHRVGLLVTVTIYLAAAILFVSYRIAVLRVPPAAIEIDLVDPDEPRLLTPEEQQQLLEFLEQTNRTPARNRLSNEYADPSATQTSADRPANQQELYDEAQRVQRELAEGQRAFEQGLSEVEAIRTRPRTPSDQGQRSPRSGTAQQDQNTRVQGNVTVRVSLLGRTVAHWYVPAYQCRGGGTVVVGVTVGRGGEVLSASVSSVTPGAEDCISQRAVQAAYATVFNADAAAPDRQRGTITYTFVAQ